MIFFSFFIVKNNDNKNWKSLLTKETLSKNI